mmetsp:Transcript_9355/g.16402  ORF Transcript_9355/g.16402 Transcript_9355/m.16402 type:complete len:420 (-) Transcript_9355:333-1592(-)
MNEVDDARMMVANLSVSQAAKALMRTAGFRTLRDVLAVAPVRLAKELRMDAKEVLTLVNEIKQVAGEGSTSRYSPKTQVGHTALSLLEARKSIGHVVTYCEELDRLLEGGVPTGEITEFCGVPGCGKTQLCMQLAVDVTIPREFGGQGGECLYIDTEGSFAVERVQAVAQAVLQHLHNVASAMQNGHKISQLQKNALRVFGQVEDVLAKIHYCRVHNHSELEAVIMRLQALLSEAPRVKLVIIDSIAFHFRHVDDAGQRTRLLNSIAQALNSIAAEKNVAIVTSNQMTTKIQKPSGNHAGQGKEAQTSYYAPALGESWSHSITNRITIERTEMSVSRKLHRARPSAKPLQRDERGSEGPDPKRPRVQEEKRQNQSQNRVLVFIRVATLVKSPYLKPGKAYFMITKNGIRGCPKTALTSV